MKNTASSILISLCVFSARLGQTQAQPQQLPPPTDFVVSDRGPDHKIWERTVYEQTPWGPAPRVHRFHELATGMHFMRNGQYVETSERIDVLPGGAGAAATNGPHQVFFPSDIFGGVIEIIGADGRRQQSRPWGIAYFEGTNSALIAELQHSTGQLLPSGNQIIYTNCFTDFQADIIATYRKNGIECDLVFRQKPPLPGVFNVSENCRLQLLTEFFNTSDPVEKPAPVDPGDGLSDTRLEFGSLKIVSGRAFFVGSQPQTQSRLSRGARNSGVPVYKSWHKIQDNGTNRSFLIEEVPYSRIKPQLDQLAATSKPARYLSVTGSLRQLVASARRHPQTPVVPKPVRLAKADLSARPGLLLDYVQVSGSDTNYTFLGDTTYLVSGEFDIRNLTLEPGTCVKFPEGDPSGSIYASGDCFCQGQPYLPAVLTSANDDSCGEVLPSSTGTPGLGIAYYLTFDAITNSLHNLRILYADIGVYVDHAPINVSDSQFIHCTFALDNAAMQPYSLHNILFSDCTYPTAEDLHRSITVRGENLTLDQCSEFAYSGSPSAYLTNSIITALGGTLPSPGTNNPTVVLLSSGAGVFQSVGGGSYYLADASPYRGIGTTNLSTNMLARLRQTTTFPPMVYSNVAISNDVIVGPQAPRDSGSSPALGYHYDPLDYAFGGVDANANLTFTAGTAVGWFRTSSGWNHAGHGIHAGDTYTIAFNGTFETPDYWVRCSTAQEGGNGQWEGGYGPGGITGWNTSAASNAPVVTARFTHCCQFVGEAMHFRDDNGRLTVRLKDCDIYNGGIGGYESTINLTNCLLHRVSVWQFAGDGDENFTFRNCTMRGQSLTIGRWGAPPTPNTFVSIRDCAFDGTTFSTADSYATNSTYTDYNFNAFTTNSSYTYPSGSNDVYVTSFNWQTGPVGSWYLPSDSTLIDAGSFTNSALAGLYHYTTLTNQTKEANNPLDIGLHRLALDANGNPSDADNDGVPDYLEDPNGNGIVDSGETDWNSATDLGLKVIITRPKNNSVIP